MHHDPVASRPILAGVDGGPGTAEVVRAAERLATTARAELVVAHIVAVPLSMFPEVAALGMILEEDVIAEMLPEIWIALADSAVRWKVVSSRGVPASELVRLSRELRPSAIVVGSDSSGWAARLRRGLNGSVPGRLARHQDAPVVVIPAACSHRRRGQYDRSPRTIESAPS
jgi:nucleotide-binding universal stress UspA family protein